ncbi:MAG: hypothetical protein H6R16_3773 [Proteobacteria bacterium]|nr:hypothetical protein [Pseudomonadota bacterium]
MMISPYAFSLLLAGLAGQPAYAEPLYKWVDSTGQVTYSSTPPLAGVKAEKVKVLQPPSDEDIKQAEERVKRTEEQASELENKRLDQEAKEAEEARLREAQQPQPPIVIERPVYVPQPIYYPPAHRPRPPVGPRPHPPVEPLPSPLPR